MLSSQLSANRFASYQAFLAAIDKDPSGLSLNQMHHNYPLKRSRFNALVREVEDAGLIESDTPLQNRKDRYQLARPGNFKLTVFGRQFLEKCRELDALTNQARLHVQAEQ